MWLTIPVAEHHMKWRCFGSLAFNPCRERRGLPLKLTTPPSRYQRALLYTPYRAVSIERKILIASQAIRLLRSFSH